MAHRREPRDQPAYGGHPGQREEQREGDERRLDGRFDGASSARYDQQPYPGPYAGPYDATYAAAPYATGYGYGYNPGAYGYPYEVDPRWYGGYRQPYDGHPAQAQQAGWSGYDAYASEQGRDWYAHPSGDWRGSGSSGSYEGNWSAHQGDGHRPRAYHPSIHLGSSNSARQGGVRRYTSEARQTPSCVPSSEWDRRAHRSTQPSLSPSRQQGGKERQRDKMWHLSIPKEPRPYYMQQTLRTPEHYPPHHEPPKPLPLLVLDLNGTLVYRGSRSSGSTSERSRKPKLRPFLGSFLEYCLAVQGSQGDFDQQQQTWERWDAQRNINEGEEADLQPDTLPSLHTHGSHFWPERAREPDTRPDATFRLLLWSSAQPQNVDLMARAILSPEQAGQLLRVYARDTLVTKRFYSLKAPSTKDLEILWTSLNNPIQNGESLRRGEERLFADTREREAHQAGDQTLAAEDLRVLWEGNVCVPCKNADTGHYDDGHGYGPHNTLLLDDSVEKARLQPFNHILIPEYDFKRAEVADRYQKRSASPAESSQNDAGEEERKQDLDEVAEEKLDIEEPEDVLLQVIGVLEHARYQSNVSSWIRFGGLGDVGGMGTKHPYYLDDGEMYGQQRDDDVRQEVDPIVQKWAEYFSKSCPADELDVRLPRLDARVEDRSPAFWATEGREALMRKGIRVRMFA